MGLRDLERLFTLRRLIEGEREPLRERERERETEWDMVFYFRLEEKEHSKTEEGTPS